MLSIGDVVQPGALGSSYGMGPYTVIPGGAGANSLAASPAAGTSDGVSSLGETAAPGSTASQAVPATSGLSSAPAAPSNPASSVFGAPSSATVPTASPPGSIDAASSDSPLQSALGSGSPSGEMPGAGLSAPSGVVQAPPDLASAGAASSSSLPVNTSGGPLATPSMPGSVGDGAAFTQPDGLATASLVPQTPLGEDPDSYRAIMAILKGGSST